MKQCRDCGEIKDESCFYPSTRNKDKLFSNCSDCCRIKNKEYYHQKGKSRAGQYYYNRKLSEARKMISEKQLSH